jgi:hypothetical protein
MTSKNFELKNPESGLTTSLPVRRHHRSGRARYLQPQPRPRRVHLRSGVRGNRFACESKITYIDGDAGVLLYRGYPVEQLAEKSTFMEVATC